jgi:hypothetical protein
MPAKIYGEEHVVAELNDTEAARVALEQVWRELATLVDDAKARGEAAAQNPSLLADPRTDAETRWLWLFDRELSDVQTVYRSAESGARLSTESLRAAAEAGKKLRDILQQARDRVSEPVA